MSDDIVPSSEYFVNRLLKNHRINTIIGPSGAGKSKWITQQIHCMAYGDPFLGFPTEPLPPTYYISLDRSQPEVEKLMHHAELLDIPQFHFASWRPNLPDLVNEHAFVERLKYLDAEVFILEGLGFLIKDVIKQRNVGLLFSAFDRWMNTSPVTIELSHHTAKSREGHAYLNHREKALGSGAWAQCSDLYTSIEYAQSVNKNIECHDTRIAYVTSNDFKDIEVPFVIVEETGKLELESVQNYIQRTGKSKSSYFRDQNRRYSGQ